MSVATDLTKIFDMIHNENSTSTMPPEFEFGDDEENNSFLDKYVLKWV